MITVMDIIVLDVYIPCPFTLPFALTYPASPPVRSFIFLVDGISTHVLVYTTNALCIHTYIYIYTYAYTREETR